MASSMDWSLLISLLALGTSVFTYFRHDRKLKKQEQKINNYQIVQMEAAAEENKKALICGDVSKDGDSRILTIVNKGTATAKNIRIEGLDVSYIWHNGNGLLPYEQLNNLDKFSIRIIPTGFIRRNTLPITFRWDDEYATNRENVQIIPLI